VAATPIPKPGQADRERRARYIGEWLKTEARYLASWPNPAASRRLGRSTIPIRTAAVFHRSLVRSRMEFFTDRHPLVKGSSLGDRR